MINDFVRFCDKFFVEFFSGITTTKLSNLLKSTSKIFFLNSYVLNRLLTHGSSSRFEELLTMVEPLIKKQIVGKESLS